MPLEALLISGNLTDSDFDGIGGGTGCNFIFFKVEKTKTTSVEDVALRILGLYRSPRPMTMIYLACSSTDAISFGVLQVLQIVDDLPLVLPFIVGTDGHPRYLQKEFPWLKLCEDGNTCCCSVCYWAIVNKRIRNGQRGYCLLKSKWVKKEDAAELQTRKVT